MQPDIEGLEWDDENETHLAEHLDPETVANMIAGGDWVVFPNRKHHPRERRLLIGRHPGGSMVTVILEPTRVPGYWRPVTGWWSTRAEANRYDQARRYRRG
jgi:uncharacterized DUF497 family protein